MLLNKQEANLGQRVTLGQNSSKSLRGGNNQPFPMEAEGDKTSNVNCRDTVDRLFQYDKNKHKCKFRGKDLDNFHLTEMADYISFD